MVVPKYPGCVVPRIQVQPNVFIFCVISFNNFRKFLLLRNSAWDFLGGNYFGSLSDSGIFLGFVRSPMNVFGL